MWNGTSIDTALRIQWYHLMHLSRLEVRMAGIAITARVVLFVVLLFGVNGVTHEVSRDALSLHYQATEASDTHHLGLTDWGRMIDDAWPLIAGLLYYYVRESLLIVVVFNALCAGASVILTYRIAQMVTENRVVAAASAYTIALFPSAVFFQCLPIKESAAMLSIVMAAWGILRVRLRGDLGGVKWIVVGTLVIVGLRVYLAPIYVYCAALTMLVGKRRSIWTALIPVTIWSGLLVLGLLISLDALGLEWRQMRAFEYLDLDNLNRVRVSLARGSGAIFSRWHTDGFEISTARHEFGTHGLLNDLTLLIKGIYYFFVGIDFSNIRSSRQMAAVPEALVMVVGVPYMFYGVKHLLRYHHTAAVPVLVFTAALFCVYGAGTTNMGAMYRWRIQAMPFVAMLIFQGAASWRRGPAYSVLLQVRDKFC